jgi:hypothetical protein
VTEESMASPWTPIFSPENIVQCYSQENDCV